MNYPDTFDIALNAAGPVTGFGDISDPTSYNWWNWVSFMSNYRPNLSSQGPTKSLQINQIYLDHSVVASKNISNAFLHLGERLVSSAADPVLRFFSVYL